MRIIKINEEIKLDKLIENAEISVSEDEYSNLTTLMIHDYEYVVDWVLWQMKSYDLTFEEALIRYIII